MLENYEGRLSFGYAARGNATDPLGREALVVQSRERYVRGSGLTTVEHEVRIFDPEEAVRAYRALGSSLHSLGWLVETEEGGDDAGT